MNVLFLYIVFNINNRENILEYRKMSTIDGLKRTSG